jgi:hypothetical protein
MGQKDIMDMHEVGCGPLTLDVRMATGLGWTREDIEHAKHALLLLGRGTAATLAFRSGQGCEHCGRVRSSIPGNCDVCCP